MLESHYAPWAELARKRIGVPSDDRTNWTRMSPQPDEQAGGTSTRPHSEEL